MEGKSGSFSAEDSFSGYSVWISESVACEDFTATIVKDTEPDNNIGPSSESNDCWLNDASDDDGVDGYYEVFGFGYLSDYGGGYTVSEGSHTMYIADSDCSNWRCSRRRPCSIRRNSSCDLWWCSSSHWFDPRTYSQEQGACCCYATRWTDDGRTNDATTCSADATTCSADAAAAAPVQEMPQQTTQQGYEFEQK